MPKVTLDMKSFKALSSDTRLNILKSLDGKKMNLKDLSSATNLNKATLHEHLTKLTEAGLVKRKERQGHKWVYYKLTFKGEGLLHPENTRIVVLFTVTFIALAAGIVQFINYFRTKVYDISTSTRGGLEDYTTLTDGQNKFPHGSTPLGNGDTINITVPENSSKWIDVTLNYGTDGGNFLTQEQIFLYIAIACFAIFIVALCISIWRYNKNKTPKL